MSASDSKRAEQYEAVLQRLSMEERPKPELKPIIPKSSERDASKSAQPQNSTFASRQQQIEKARAWLREAAEVPTQYDAFTAPKTTSTKMQALWGDATNGNDEAFDIDAPVPNTRQIGAQGMRENRVALQPSVASFDVREMRQEFDADINAQFAAEAEEFSRTKKL